MFKIKVISFILIFSILLIATSIIKNQTREIEKKIYELNKKISFQEKRYLRDAIRFFIFNFTIRCRRKSK